MDKVKKIIIICIFFCTAICLISTKVYAFPTEVFNATKITNGIPDSYDVKVKADILGDVINIPNVQVSIEDVLYGDNPTYSINYFEKITDANKSSESDKGLVKTWHLARDFVRAFSRIALYISATILVTLLLYIAIIIALSGYSNDGSFPSTEQMMQNPIKRIFGRGKKSESKNPQNAKKDKVFIEEWVKAVFALIGVLLVISLTIELSNKLSNYSNENTKEASNITIYVEKGEKDGEEIEDFYFHTNTEGFYMFMSQLNWEEYGQNNLSYIVSGRLVLVFKKFIRALLIIRMWLCGFIIVVAPLIVLINAFMKISGNKGILMSWFKWFFYFAMIRPIAAILFYWLIESNVDSVGSNPFYILLVTILIDFIIISSGILLAIVGIRGGIRKK